MDNQKEGTTANDANALSLLIKNSQSDCRWDLIFLIHSNGNLLSESFHIIM